MEIITWLNNNTGAIQAIATSILVLVTIYYAWQTRRQVILSESLQKPKIKISGSYGHILGIGDNKEVLMSEICNVGSVPVVIQNAGLTMENKRKLVSLDPTMIDLPKKLGPGEGVTLYYEKGILDKELKKEDSILIGLECVDVAGNKYYGEIKEK